MSTQFKAAAEAFLRKEIAHLAGEDDFVEVTGFDFQWDDGYTYSSYTHEDPSFQVTVDYRLNGEPLRYHLYKDETTTMGDFLTRLLEDEEGGQ
jgi:hypothetical protein